MAHHPTNELNRALADVMRHQMTQAKAPREVDAAHRRSKLRAGRRVSPVIAGCVAILAVTGAYLVIDRPSWLAPTPVVAESREERDASLRMGIATTAQRIERFRQQTGRLPKSIAELGSTVGGVQYERTDDEHYVLHGHNGPVELLYQSTDPLSAFVGSSFELLARRGHR